MEHYKKVEIEDTNQEVYDWKEESKIVPSSTHNRRRLAECCPSLKACGMVTYVASAWQAPPRTNMKRKATSTLRPYRAMTRPREFEKEEIREMLKMVVYRASQDMMGRSHSIRSKDRQFITLCIKYRELDAVAAHASHPFQYWMTPLTH